LNMYSLYMYIYWRQFINVAVMSSRNPYFKRKKCRGNVDLKIGKNVAVMSCEILQCRGNVFLPNLAIKFSYFVDYTKTATLSDYLHFCISVPFWKKCLLGISDIVSLSCLFFKPLLYFPPFSFCVYSTIGK